MNEAKQRGRKRIHPVGRKRHNLNMERDETFNADLALIMSDKNLNQTDAIKLAVSLLAEHIEKIKELNNADR